MRALAWAACAVLLAGCASPPGQDPAGARPEAIVLADLTSAGCVYNDVVFLAPREEVQTRLPEGWTARAAFAEAPDVGGFVVNFFDCAEGFAWNGADMFALVETPPLPAIAESFDAANRTPRASDHIALDLYMLAAHTSHPGLSAVFSRAGMDLGPGNVTKRSTATPAGSQAEGSVADERGPIMSYSVTGALTGQGIAHHRQWRQTEEGILLVERVMSDSGAPLTLTQGAARCTMREDAAFAKVLGATACAPRIGQDITTPLSWEGRAYVFFGLRPAAR